MYCHKTDTFYTFLTSPTPKVCFYKHECFIDAGIYCCCDPLPPGYKKIRAHLVFDVKHNGRHKAQYAGSGHLTDVPVESVYSGVISLLGLSMVAFLSELNDLEL
jgi:hypothetical protein